ncbi:hypothetical protein K1S88_26970, partial [Klebsiella pneumoniae]|nr:hypothetical protein [Klebsiella pneumoniae]
MSHFYERKAYRYPLYALAALAVLMAIGLFYFQWLLGLVALLGVGFVLYYVIGAQRSLHKELEHYISNLSHR